MALKKTKDTIVTDAISSHSSVFRYRNLAYWERGTSYGMRLFLSKEGVPDTVSIMSFTFCDTDDMWVSLCRAQGLDHRSKMARAQLAQCLEDKDCLSIAGANDSRTAYVCSARPGIGELEPAYACNLSPILRKMLGGVTKIQYMLPACRALIKATGSAPVVRATAPVVPMEEADAMDEETLAMYAQAVEEQ